jgi:predicted nucleotide-binding protein (sugar kinase/HSP70/actin superfamily)
MTEEEKQNCVAGRREKRKCTLVQSKPDIVENNIDGESDGEIKDHKKVKHHHKYIRPSFPVGQQLLIRDMSK